MQDETSRRPSTQSAEAAAIPPAPITTEDLSDGDPTEMYRAEDLAKEGFVMPNLAKPKVLADGTQGDAFAIVGVPVPSQMVDGAVDSGRWLHDGERYDGGNTHLPGDDGRVRQQAAALLVFTAVASISVAAPVFVFFALGERSAEPLGRLKAWLTHNNAVILAVLLLVIGVKLIGDAIAAP